MKLLANSLLTDRRKTDCHNTQGVTLRFSSTCSLDKLHKNCAWPNRFFICLPVIPCVTRFPLPNMCVCTGAIYWNHWFDMVPNACQTVYTACQCRFLASFLSDAINTSAVQLLCNHQPGSDMCPVAHDKYNFHLDSEILSATVKPV